MHSLVFKAISEAIPHAVITMFDWLKPDPIKFLPESKQKSQTDARKTRDCTPISETDYDIIVREEEDRILFNLTKDQGIPRVTQADLIVELNKKLGLNKAKTFYSRIWNGHTVRPTNRK